MLGMRVLRPDATIVKEDEDVGGIWAQHRRSKHKVPSTTARDATAASYTATWLGIPKKGATFEFW